MQTYGLCLHAYLPACSSSRGLGKHADWYRERRVSQVVVPWHAYRRQQMVHDLRACDGSQHARTQMLVYAGSEAPRSRAHIRVRHRVPASTHMQPCRVARARMWLCSLAALRSGQNALALRIPHTSKHTLTHITRRRSVLFVCVGVLVYWCGWSHKTKCDA